MNPIERGQVLQGYFRGAEAHPSRRPPAGTANILAAAVAQARALARPDALPGMAALPGSAPRLRTAAQPAVAGSATAQPRASLWSRAPRPDLLPGGMTALGAAQRARRVPTSPGRTAPQGLASAMRLPPASGLALVQRGGQVRVTQLAPAPLQLSGPGNPLAGDLRRSLEDLLQTDLSPVRVHQGTTGLAIGATAFTMGEHIWFAPGRFDPGGHDGLQLLGHELAHVVQQRSGRVANPFGHGLAVVQDPVLEAEADHLARVVAGRGIAQLARRRGNGRSQDWQQTLKKAIQGLLGAGNFTLSREQEAGPYDRVFEEPRLFWRGDDRDHNAVLKTGFTSKNERNTVTEIGENTIVWRSGNNQDDVDEDTGVCVARDVRGSAFFPLEKPAKYIYAVALTRATSTFDAQQDAEAADTGSGKMSAERYPYDPGQLHPDKQSTIWQYQEYVAHRIDKSEIAACYEIERELLIDDQGSTLYREKFPMAGIRFKLELVWERPNPSGALRSVIAQARDIAANYEAWYPDGDDVYLSYFGVIEDKDPDDQSTTMAGAATKYHNRKLVQRDGLAGPAAEDEYDRTSSQKHKAKQHSKARKQKQRNK